MCANKMVRKPNLIPNVINRSIKEIPVTISALIIGIFVIPMMMERFLFFILLMAKLAIVPIIVEISAAKKAITNVLISDWIMASFSNNATYHFKVNPPHLALVLLALKERTIKVIIGAYRKIKIKQI